MHTPVARASPLPYRLHTQLSCTLRLHTPHCHTSALMHTPPPHCHTGCILNSHGHSGCTPPRSYRLHTPKVIPVAYSTFMQVAPSGCTLHTVIQVAYSRSHARSGCTPPLSYRLHTPALMHTPVARPRRHGGPHTPTALPVAYSALMHVAHPACTPTVGGCLPSSGGSSCHPCRQTCHLPMKSITVPAAHSSCTLRFAHTQVCTHSSLHTSCHPCRQACHLPMKSITVSAAHSSCTLRFTHTQVIYYIPHEPPTWLHTPPHYWTPKGEQICSGKKSNCSTFFPRWRLCHFGTLLLRSMAVVYMYIKSGADIQYKT